MKKATMVNVRADLWYEVMDYTTDAHGAIVEVKADNGQWYKATEVAKII